MWTFKQSHVEPLQDAAKTFEEKTGIAVEVEAITPDDAFVTKTQAAAQTGDTPDIWEVHTNGDDFVFGAAGLLEDLADDVDDEWSAQYLPSVADQGTVTPLYYEQSLAEGSSTAGVEEGQRFSVPFTIGTFGIVYANKERLEAAGITEAPKTWEEFVAALDAVQKTNPDDGGMSLGLQAPTTGLEWLMQPMAYGQLGADDFHALFGQDPAGNFGSPNGVAVLENYDKITPYWMPGTQTLTIDDADLAFAQGKSSFALGGTFTLAFLAQNGMDPENIVTFPVPSPEGGAIPDLSLSPFALTGLSVSATTENKDGALEWMRYLSEPDVAAEFATSALDVPPVDLGDDPSSTVGPVLGAMLSSFGEGEDAYNPGDTSYRPSAYDGEQVANVLMEMSPLGTQDAPKTGAGMATLITDFWSQS
ncbi:extracellular solute-binding protein [Cellulosimicrobium terreum]|nr:extracellular solute-binding protein [Cellulosimicrobium terreum]